MSTPDRRAKLDRDHPQLSDGGLDSLRAYAAMIADLGHALPPGSPIRRNPQFNQLMKRRYYRNLHVIPSSHAPMTGAMDFSEKSIMERYKRGYDAADKTIRAGLVTA
jgi:hypothetical protein